MDVLSALVAVTAIVLAVGGVLKLTDTEPTRALLDSVDLPDPAAAVVVLGVVEVAVGAGVLAGMGALFTATLAGLYSGFTALLVVVLRRNPGGVDCGCFGRYSSPPSRVHVAVNAISAALAFGALALGAPSLPEVVEGQPAAGVPLLLGLLVGALAVLAISTRAGEAA